MKINLVHLALLGSLSLIFVGCGGEPTVTAKCIDECDGELGIENGLGDCACTNTCSSIADCEEDESCTYSSDIGGRLCVPIGTDCFDTDLVCFGFMSCILDVGAGLTYCSADCDADIDCPAAYICGEVDRGDSIDKRCILP